MDDPDVVSYDEWLVARKALLEQEKAFTRQRDALAAERRRLPMEEVERDYRFQGENGEASLLDLFDGRDQLLVYHFMWLADEHQGCPSCSFLVDNIGDLSHLHARNTSLVLVSRGPIDELLAYRARMRWAVPWYSSLSSSFNYDFHVTIDPGVAPVEYNFKDQAQLEAENVAWRDWSGEQPGTSAFLRHGDRVFHTYSSYARGGDLLIGTYNWLDLTARGRQEDFEEPPGRSDSPFMGWLHGHDEYPG
jgi:predicted dithiol-disulfide oxidoreductase (DUF899 family)